MLLPSMYALEPTSALIMLAGIYYGAQYGGSTTAILINVPGEASSVVTALDGHQMARQGRAGTALATAALGSFFAGTVGTLVVAAFAPPLTKLAFQFGAPEYCALMFLGLVGAVVLASGSLVKALAMVVLGLLLGQINTDVITAQPRFSFGITELMDGLNFVAIAMGVFSFGEIIANLGKPAEHREVFVKKVTGLWPSKKDFRDASPAVARGTLLGCVLGILPGAGPMLASFTSYAVEKKLSKHPEEFGKGAIQGVAAPESANNAGAQTSFIPMLTLGIPTSAVMALMVGAMVIMGIQPGPQVMTSNPALFWGLDHLDVGRQPDAGDTQPSADRHLGEAADGAVPVPLPGNHGVLRDRLLHARQQQLRGLLRGALCRRRLRPAQAGLRARAADPRLHPGAADGRESAARVADVERRLERVCHAADFGVDAGDLRWR